MVKDPLNILGCVPSLLNILIELANEARHYTEFKVIQNIPVDLTGTYVMLEEWNVKYMEFSKDSIKLSPKDHFALSVVGTNSKKQVYEFFKNHIQMPEEQFLNMIHPTSYVSRSVKLSHGLQMEPLCSISSCSSIGAFVNIKRNSTIGHHCEIGDYSTINPGVAISGEVIIGKQTMIGTGTVIKDRISVGNNCIIGVGSVVVKDIPDNSIAYGNPCVVHKINKKN
ncbi:MAG: hypothetical protein R8G66_12970 [Cytophagales bacterium]|nr:hypothetical protein [Cytophagales bacterium]